jgi:hypothetical protein
MADVFAFTWNVFLRGVDHLRFPETEQQVARNRRTLSVTEFQSLFQISFRDRCGHDYQSIRTVDWLSIPSVEINFIVRIGARIQKQSKQMLHFAIENAKHEMSKKSDREYPDQTEQRRRQRRV